MSHQKPIIPASAHAIAPSRLTWLCQPEQIEQTLALLFALNSWKRANQRLLYADRQGLQEVQALVLEQAVKTGVMQAARYVDGTRHFPGGLLLASVAEEAARNMLLHLQRLRDPEIWPSFSPEGDRVYQQSIRPFYTRLTGTDFLRASDAADALDLTQIRASIQEHLQKLVAHASTTRQPIPPPSLSDLCITPTDLLPIRDNRLYYLDGYDTWEDLESSDLCKLDPEGASEIAFWYTSPNAAFIFHLPFRRAEAFVPPKHLRALQRVPGLSQEQGISQGRPIDETESLKHPVKELLQDLGVDIATVCPHDLREKADYLASPAIRDLLWPTRGDDDEEWADDPWDQLCLPPTER